MLLSVMIGIVIITYFIGDIVNRSKIEEIKKDYGVEITDINVKNEQFTSHFIESTVSLDQARDRLALGDYNYKLAFLWYYSALNENNITDFNLFKIRGVDNCSKAIPVYQKSAINFNLAESFFRDTKNYTSYYKYLEILDLYINLTKSGYNLTLLKEEACNYLQILIENLIIDEQTGNVTYLGNVSDTLRLLDEALLLIDDLEEGYERCQDYIDDYLFFDEIR